MWHSGSCSGQEPQWQCKLRKPLALQDLNFHLCSPIGTPPLRLMKSFPRVCQGHSYLLQKFASHPAYFLFRLVCVMGKGFVEWGKLIFLFCFEWFCSESLLFPTSCWQGFKGGLRAYGVTYLGQREKLYSRKSEVTACLQNCLVC